jgi:hypothetical protein
MTASDFDRDRDVIFFADTREESIYTAFFSTFSGPQIPR